MVSTNIAIDVVLESYQDVFTGLSTVDLMRHHLSFCESHKIPEFLKYFIDQVRSYECRQLFQRHLSAYVVFVQNNDAQGLYGFLASSINELIDFENPELRVA